MLSSQGKLFSDANSFCRRAHDYLLPLPEMWQSMEGKLKRFFVKLTNPNLASSHGFTPFYYFSFSYILYFLLIVSSICATANCSNEVSELDSSYFSIVVFMCVWKRPIVTRFVLHHFASLNATLLPLRISLELFIVGSDPVATHELASSVNSAFVIHPNNPVGQKHQLGLQSLREHYVAQVRAQNRQRLPDVVAIFGSDDIVPAEYFSTVRQHFNPPVTAHQHTIPMHVLGLRDVWFFDLRSGRLAYTPGYRSFSSPLAGTVGCGRAFSWSFLDSVQWKLWDVDRDRGLDQSVVRNLMRSNVFMPEVSVAISGRKIGVYAVDIKTDSFENAGINVWSFETITTTAARSGRLLPFSRELANVSLPTAFGVNFTSKLDALRKEMELAEAV